MKLPVVLPRVRVLNFRATVAVSGTIAQARNCALFSASQNSRLSLVTLTVSVAQLNSTSVGFVYRIRRFGPHIGGWVEMLIYCSMKCECCLASAELNTKVTAM
jgi:hypothetical protein